MQNTTEKKATPVPEHISPAATLVLTAEGLQAQATPALCQLDGYSAAWLAALAGRTLATAPAALAAALGGQAPDTLRDLREDLALPADALVLRVEQMARSMMHAGFLRL